MIDREPIRERMAGRWHGVLPMLGVSESFLANKHGPCPMCGGKDRWRFDDRDGHGTWICNQCGAGDGVSLVMKAKGWDFKTAAEEIEKLMGDVEPKAPKVAPDPKQQLEDMRGMWRRAKPPGELVHRYLRSRGIDGEYCNLGELWREMVALMRAPDGQGCMVHRTLLTADGRRDSRLFMPGTIPDGAAVRLMPHGDVLGIAEGIETALSASILFEIPCWAALNTSLLKKWTPPADVKRVVIFGDCDANFAGHAAAYELARRLAEKVSVSVEIPRQIGTDWNDVLREQAKQQQSA
jgi:putative DNA primase/helicase